jgi:precorrin-8X/cobalt-precorrin-8 methylmutase
MATTRRTVPLTITSTNEIAMAPRFDHYVIVDWSAANQPKRGRDSIWICDRSMEGEARVENPATRHDARLLLIDILDKAARRGDRVVLGFDFPFGYPAGFAAALGLAGTPWRALWDEIATLLKDGEDNRNNRFELAAEFNRRVSNGRFPFWGCPPRRHYEFLGPKHHRLHDSSRLAEKRLIDSHMKGAQPCWKLAYTGSVGSQSLTGIPVVRALRDEPRWADRAAIWPFETGLALAAEIDIVFAEVWPSWWRARRDLGPPNDKAQVCTVADIFAERDRAGELSAWFCGDPTLGEEDRRVVVAEEAWTLGVTAPRARRGSASETGRGPRRSDLHPHPPSSTAEGPRGGKPAARGYDYLREPGAITRRSLALVRAEADLTRFPPPLRGLASRIAQATGDPPIIDTLAWSAKAVAAGRAALAADAPVIVDATMVAAGITRGRLGAGNEILCFLREPSVALMAAQQRITHSAAQVELWRPYLKGAVVAIGNAPTALFRLLEVLAAGGDRPALVLGFPVGLVGATEAKAALASFGQGLDFVTLHGRRGGSAVAAAAVNALAEHR